MAAAGLAEAAAAVMGRATSVAAVVRAATAEKAGEKAEETVV